MSDDPRSPFTTMAIPPNGLEDVRRRARSNALQHQLRVLVATTLALIGLSGTTIVTSNFFYTTGNSITDTTTPASLPVVPTTFNAFQAPVPPIDGSLVPGARPSLLGLDASEWLYVTLLGSVVLLPLTVAFTIFRNRRSSLPLRRLPTVTRAVIIVLVGASLVTAVMTIIS